MNLEFEHKVGEYNKIADTFTEVNNKLGKEVQNLEIQNSEL
jgi:hypothetical protein